MRIPMLCGLTVLAVAAGLTAGCGGQMSQAASPAESAAGTDLYQQISRKLIGSPQQRLANEALVAAEVQQGIADCMAKAGFDYKMAGSENTQGGPAIIGELTSIVPLGGDGFGIAAFKQGVAQATDQRVNPAYEQLDEAARKARGAAAGKCISEAPEPVDFRPPHFFDLREGLVGIFTAIENRSDVKDGLAEYGDCMENAGFPASNYPELHGLIEAKYPDAEQGWATLNSTEAWTAAVDFERNAARADTTCRRDVHDTVMALAAPALTTYAATNAAKLDASAAAWTKRTAVN
jgi:hypothetical protein